MKSIEYCQKKFMLRTNANDARHTITGNDRVIYYLLFRENVGWDWVQSQIHFAADRLGIDIQMWKLYSSDDGFEISVKEVEKRSVDVTDQETLGQW